MCLIARKRELESDLNEWTCVVVVTVTFRVVGSFTRTRHPVQVHQVLGQLARACRWFHPAHTTVQLHGHVHLEPTMILPLTYQDWLKKKIPSHSLHHRAAGSFNAKTTAGYSSSNAYANRSGTHADRIEHSRCTPRTTRRSTFGYSLLTLMVPGTRDKSAQYWCDTGLQNHLIIVTIRMRVPTSPLKQSESNLEDCTEANNV